MWRLYQPFVTNQMFSSFYRKPELQEQQSTVLARLCVYCILSTLETPTTPSKKRARPSDSDDTDAICSITKMRKLEHSTDSTSTDFMNESNRDPPFVLREPMQSCLQNLFKTFAFIANSDDLTPKLYFIYEFLSLLVQCGKDRIKPILKLIPSGLIQSLLKVMSTDEITVGLVLRFVNYDTELNFFLLNFVFPLDWTTSRFRRADRWRCQTCACSEICNLEKMV